MTRRLIAVAGFVLAGACAAGATASQPSAEWIKRTKERIESLLGPKHDTTPLPANLPNPFRPAGKPEPEITHPQDHGPVTPASNTETLARLVATLKFNGLVQIAGVPQVIINQLSYKEGDLVAVRAGEQATYLRVLHISADAITLELNKAEQTVHLK